MTRHIALATCDALPDGDVDDLTLMAALRRIGITVSLLAWSDPSVDWHDFDATVIRSTWDYTVRRTEFLAWADAVPRLFNPAAVIHDNSDKRYLGGLAEAGVPVVPTLFVGPGATVELPSAGEFVVKPSVGAGSRGVGRFDATQPASLDAAREHARTLHEVGRTVLIQPYQSGVDAAGESGLIFFDGVFSHAVCKGAMLQPGGRHEFDARALYIEENITARQPQPAEIELAERVLAQLSAHLTEPLLYARIDLLPGEHGPLVVEAELTEPSLFFEHSDGGADVLAAAIAKRVG